jgi:hypothetical protein
VPKITLAIEVDSYISANALALGASVDGPNLAHVLFPSEATARLHTNIRYRRDDLGTSRELKSLGAPHFFRCSRNLRGYGSGAVTGTTGTVWVRGWRH